MSTEAVLVSLPVRHVPACMLSLQSLIDSGFGERRQLQRRRTMEVMMLAEMCGRSHDGHMTVNCHFAQETLSIRRRKRKKGKQKLQN